MVGLGDNAAFPSHMVPTAKVINFPGNTITSLWKRKEEGILVFRLHRMLAKLLRYTPKSSTVSNELSCRNIGLQASVNLEHVTPSKADTVLGQANGAFVRLAKSNHYNWRICKHP